MFGTFLQHYHQYTLEDALDMPWMTFVRLLKALRPEQYRDQAAYSETEQAVKKMRERRSRLEANSANLQPVQ